jgi:integrase
MRFRSGSWTLEVRAGKDRQGQPRKLTATVKAANNAQGRRIAERALIELVARADRIVAGDIDAERTLLDAVSEYIEWSLEFGGKRETGISPKTLENYVGHRAAIAASPWADQKLVDLGPQHIVQLREWLQREHGNNRAGDVLSFVSTALTKAVEWNWVPVNVARDIKKPRRTKQGRPRDYTASDHVVAQVLDIIERSDPLMFAVVHVAADTGARRGSLAGLRWADIDFDAGTIRIERGITNGAVLDTSDPDGWKLSTAGYHVGTTKSGSVSLVAVQNETLRVLRRYRRWMMSRSTQASEWVFPAPSDPSRPVRPAYLGDQWNRIRRSLMVTGRVPGLTDKITLHSLRRYVGTQLVAANIDPVTVARRLGHSDPRTTMRLYADMLPENDRAAANVLAEVRRRVG